MQLTPVLTRNSLFFFVGIFAIVLLGFWASYFANPFQVSDVLLHLHGIGMTSWCVMLIAQPYFIRTKRLDLHRLVGKAAYLVVPANVLMQIVVVRRGVPTFDDSFSQGEILAPGYVFIAEALIDAALFGLFFLLAIANKKTPAIHARYMLCTPLPVIAAAVDRIIRAYAPGLAQYVPQVAGGDHLQTYTWILVDLGLLALVIWDLKARRPVNVFARVLLILLASQLFIVYSYEMPFIRTFGDWFIGV